MLTLAEFLSKKRKYIAAIYNDETQANLRKWCEQNGFDLSKKYKGEDIDPKDYVFHTTIIYSETIHDIPNGKLTLVEPFKVRPFGFELLGEDKDIPVMKVDGHGLYKTRENYVNDFEMRDKWKIYKPHISLSYVRNPNTDFSKIKLPTFKLWIERIDIEDIDAPI